MGYNNFYTPQLPISRYSRRCACHQCKHHEPRTSSCFFGILLLAHVDPFHFHLHVIAYAYVSCASNHGVSTSLNLGHIFPSRSSITHDTTLPHFHRFTHLGYLHAPGPYLSASIPSTPDVNITTSFIYPKSRRSTISRYHEI